jgi:hypothetical protein
MRLSRSARTVTLTVHITTSVGWLALVACALAVRLWAELAVVGTALGSGLVLAAGSAYGLARYWWVLAKLAGSTAAVALGALSLSGTLPDRVQLGVRVVALGALLAMVVLSVAKPRGSCADSRDTDRTRPPSTSPRESVTVESRVTENPITKV